MKKCILYLFTACFLLTACNKENAHVNNEPARPRLNAQDSLAIVAFYHSMKCAEWKEPFHWDLKDYTTWGGVTVVLDPETNEYRVTEIETPFDSRYYLPAGYSLPAELGNLSCLRYLIVWGDSRAQGGIPPEIFNCPLEYLHIEGKANGEKNKGFYGSIPKEIGKAGDTMKWVYIVNTNIGGEIPEEIASLQHLRTPLYLYGNEFMGKVPLCLRKLPVVTSLYDNYFTEMDWRYYTESIGYVPDLNDNCLSGDIPAEVLDTERWKKFQLRIENQRTGYGYNKKYFN